MTLDSIHMEASKVTDRQICQSIRAELLVTSLSVALLRASSYSLITSLKIRSMASRLLPRVSGTRKSVQISEDKQKTAKKAQAPNPVLNTRGGLIRSMIKLLGSWNTSTVLLLWLAKKTERFLTALPTERDPRTPQNSACRIAVMQ